MSDIAEKTIKQIEDRDLKPEPRWHFVARNYVFWIFFVVAIVIGAFATSTIIFLLTDYDWNLYPNPYNNLIKHALLSVPYLWIIVLLIFVAVAYYNFKHTRRGYKYGPYLLLLLSIVLSVILGFVLFYYGEGPVTHNFLSEKAPIYRNLVHDKRDIWAKPDNGLLAGQIIKIESRDALSLRDLAGKIWDILCGIPNCFTVRQAVREGEYIKIRGYIQGPGVFIVNSVGPWGR